MNRTAKSIAFSATTLSTPTTSLLLEISLGPGVKIGQNTRCYFKLDCKLPSGSYKYRAASLVIRLHGGSKVLVVPSTGNHALGSIYAAKENRSSAVIIVPKIEAGVMASAKLQAVLDTADSFVEGQSEFNKLDKMKLLVDEGPRVIVVAVDGNFDVAQAFAKEVSASDEMYRLLHPFDDDEGFTANMQMGFELASQLAKSELNGRKVLLVAAAGGGGYGVAAALGLHLRSWDVNLVLAELEGQHCCSHALDAGLLVALPGGIKDNYVDATAVGKMGEMAFNGARALGAMTRVLSRHEIDSAEQKFMNVLQHAGAENYIDYELAPVMAFAALMGLNLSSYDAVVVLISGGNDARKSSINMDKDKFLI